MNKQMTFWSAVLVLMALPLLQGCEDDIAGPKARTADYQPAGAQQFVVTPATLEMRVGAKVQLRAILGDEQLEQQRVVWSSDDPAIVRITGYGIVEALTNGSVTITAEYRGALARTRVRVANTGGGSDKGGGGDDERER